MAAIRFQMQKILLAAAIALSGCGGAGGHGFALSPVGEYPLPADSPEGLSGIAWLGEDRYALAEDSGGRIHFASIAIDAATGAVTNCVFDGVASVAGLVDAEGIACDWTGGALYISDESGPKVLEVAGGAEPREVPLPEFFKEARANKSLESLALSIVDGRPLLWTANEDALRCDGAEASATNGATVRIAAFPPDGGSGASWWRYPVERAQGGPIPGAPRQTPFTGVADIAAFPGGGLLVLERSCGLVTPDDGREPSTLVSCAIWLAEVPRGPGRGELLRKRLLWRRGFPASNYEGMAIGPVLADGSTAILLVADGDVSTGTLFGKPVRFPWAKSLFALRLSAAE